MDLVNYASSAVSGAIVGALFHPFDSLYYNIVINKKKGELLRRGCAFNTITNVIKVCGIFPTQEYLKHKLSWMDKYQQDSISGMLTGLVMAFISTPINTIKVPLLTRAVNMKTVTKEIYNEHGIRGFNKGISLALARDGFGYGTYFLLYPFFNSYLDNIPISTTMASIIALCVAYPFDIARTLRQDNAANYDMKTCLKNAFKSTSENRTAFYIYMIRMILSIPAGHCTYLWTKNLIENKIMLEHDNAQE